MQVANLASFGLGLASVVFPGLPQIPPAALQSGQQLLTELNQQSSAEQFACIQGVLDDSEANDHSFQQQVQMGHVWHDGSLVCYKHCAHTAHKLS